MWGQDSHRQSCSAQVHCFFHYYRKSFSFHLHQNAHSTSVTCPVQLGSILAVVISLLKNIFKCSMPWIKYSDKKNCWISSNMNLYTHICIHAHICIYIHKCRYTYIHIQLYLYYIFICKKCIHILLF